MSFLFTGTLLAAPANDDFASRATLPSAVPSLITADNLDSTQEGGDPYGYGEGSSVWYTWTAPSSGTFEIASPNSDFEVTLGVYSGTTLASLQEVAIGWQKFSFQATAGTSYQIMVNGYDGEQGLFQLSLRQKAAPANDHFANRITLSGASPGANGSVLDATIEEGEPEAAAESGRSIWYSWTAPSTGSMRLAVLSRGQSPSAHIFTGGTLSSLVRIQSSYNGNGLTFQAVSGTTYQFAICGEHSNTSDIQINLLRTGSIPNDHFASRIALSGSFPISVVGTTVGATFQTGEPEQWDGAYPVVWYKWTPSITGTVVIESDAYSAWFSVLTGPGLGDLSEITSGNDRISFDVISGTEYQIGVSGYDGDADEFKFVIRNPQVPANDNFANATLIAGTPAVLSGTTEMATLEDGDILGESGDGATVWYSWTAPTSGYHQISTRSYNDIHVFTGSALDSLQHISYGYRSINFQAVAGTTYKIAVQGSDSETRPYEIHLRAMTVPSNDNQANPTTISGSLPVTISGTNVDATWEIGEPDPWEEQTPASVWYSWTATSTGTHEVALKTNYLEQFISVYQPDGNGGLENIDQRFNRVIFQATAGTTYTIAILGEEGPFQFTVRQVPAAPNDQFANRTSIPAGLPAVVTGHNYQATLETGDPAADDDYESSVWYSWTAPSSGRYYAGLIGEFLNAQAFVYTGTSLASLQQVSLGQGFNAVSGTTYQIGVFGSPRYAVDFRLFVARESAPANDHFANAANLTGSLPLKTLAMTAFATSETGENLTSDYQSVWYRWTATFNGPLKVAARGNENSALVRVSTGSTVGNQTTVSQDYEETGLNVSLGTTYYISVITSDRYSFAGDIELSQPSAPSNDHFANRKTIAGTSDVEIRGDNFGATLQSGEPNPISTGGASVWYSWKAPANGIFEAVDYGGGRSMILYGFTGTTLANLTLVGQGQSAMSFTAVAGTTYHFAFLGQGATQGNFEVRLRRISPPANDLFANRLTMAGTSFSTVIGETVGATLQAGEPDPLQAGSSSVWYSWTAPTSGVTEVYTPQKPCLLYIFTGTTLNSLVVRGQGFQRAEFTAVAGTTYQIAVHALSPLGQGLFDLNVESITRPVNDQFANRTTIPSSSSANVGGTTRGASLESGETGSGGWMPTSVWYQWTAPSTGSYEFTTRGLEFTEFSIFTGSSLGNLTKVLDGSNPAILQAVGGTTYQIAVYAEKTEPTLFSFLIRKAVSPSNDNFANRITLSGSLPLKTIGHNIEAGTENQEPDPNYDGGSSVWYSWTAPGTGRYEFRLIRRNFDSVIHAFTGNTLSSLQSVASGYGRLNLNAVAGTTYQIAIHGEYGNQGLFQLQVMPVVPPPNDAFANRIALPSTTQVSENGTNVAATVEPGEPDPYQEGGNSVWYSWNAPASGKYFLSLANTDIDGILYVFTGNSFASLQSVQSGYGQIAFTASAGTTYQISIHGEYGAEGDFDLLILPAPVNDLFADRTTVPAGLPVTITGTNVGATLETNEPDPFEGGSASIWFSWTAPRNGTFKISTEDSSFDTVLSVFTGTVLADLTHIATNDDDPDGVNNSSAVTFTGEAGTTYQISVRSYGSRRGSVTLSIYDASWTGTEGFHAWAGSYQLEGADGAPNGTPRQDGVPNLLKYAFGMDPSLAANGTSRNLVPGTGVSGLPSITRVDGRLRIEYVRRIYAPDLNYVPQFSSSLNGNGGWESGASSVWTEWIDEEWERVIHEDSAPASAKRFGRVLVEMTPTE